MSESSRSLRNVRRSSILGAAALLSIGLLAAPGGSASAVPKVDQVVTWGASADRVPGTFDGQTVRNLVHTSIGGSAARISLSNVFGDRTLTFDSAYLGVQASGAARVPGSNRKVTFSGQPSVTVPARAEVLSHPVSTTLRANTTMP